jgi:bifunctional ADP-heptose synthase (sugar kinase/adenylyltransferase)
MEHIMLEKDMLPEDCIFVRGDDWRDFPGRSDIEQLGIPIVLIPYTEGVSTSQIREDLKKDRGIPPPKIDPPPMILKGI